MLSSPRPRPCQLQAGEPSSGRCGPWSPILTPPTLSSIYIPQCSASGRVGPCNAAGPPEQAASGMNAGRLRTVLMALTPVELLMKIMSYREAASETSVSSFKICTRLANKASSQGWRDTLLSKMSHSVGVGREPDPAWRERVSGTLPLLADLANLTRYPGPYSDFKPLWRTLTSGLLVCG